MPNPRLTQATFAESEGVWTMTDTEFRRELRLAFMAGFEASGEGWNGEYPFDFDSAEINNALDEKFRLWLKETS